MPLQCDCNYTLYVKPVHSIQLLLIEYSSLCIHTYISISLFVVSVSINLNGRSEVWLTNVKSFIVPCRMNPFWRQKVSVLQLHLPSAFTGLKIGSFTPSCIEGMRFAVLTGRADCHYLCLTSLPSDVSMLAYFNNISCCCRSRCYRDANFQIGWKSLSWGYTEVPRMHVGCLVSSTG